MLHWQFLGTSAGMPTKQRNVSALAVGQSERKPWVLIDCGEATQHQLLRTAWSVSQLSAICITHVHGDHCYGLPGVIASASMHKRSTPLPIIASKPLWEWLQHTIALTDMHLTYDLQFIDVETLLGNSIEIDGFVIDAHVLNHRVPSHAYRLQHARHQRRLDVDKLKQDQVPTGQIWGLLQQGHDVSEDGMIYLSQDYTHTTTDKVCLVVAGDNDTPALLHDACVDADVLIHEATYTQEIADKVGTFPMHSSAQQVATFAQSVSLPHLILTHFSARYATAALIQPLLNEAQQHYSGQVSLAHDFQAYHLHENGQLQSTPPTKSQP